MALSEGKSILTKKAVGIGVGTVAVVGAAVGIILSLNGQQAFRNISVLDVIGQAKVNRTTENVEYDAYANMNLQSGDDIRVFEESELDLKLDDDKFVCAEANTHFWLEAEGTSEDSKTVIRMDEGASLHEIDKKLSDDSSYEIETPTSTMAIRGTIVRVEVLENGDTLNQVFEGKAEVFTHPVNGQPNGESLIIEAGYQCITRGDASYAEFVLQDNNGKPDKITPIDYSGLSLETLRHIRNATIKKRISYSGENEVELKHIEMFIADLEGGMPDEDRPVYYMEDLTPVFGKSWLEDHAKEKDQTPTVEPTPTKEPDLSEEIESTLDSNNDNVKGTGDEAQSTGKAEKVTPVIVNALETEVSKVTPTPAMGNTQTSESEEQATTDDSTDEVTPTPTDAVECTVMFNYNGTFATQKVKSGENASSPKLMPTKSGYWATDSAGSAIFDFSSAISEDITIYWIAE